MDYKELKAGDEVEIMCSGERVTAKITELTNDGFQTEHEPVQWGNDFFTKTFARARIDHPRYFDFNTDDKLIPHCFYNGEPITGRYTPKLKGDES